MKVRIKGNLVSAMDCRPHRSGSRYVELRMRIGCPVNWAPDLIYLRTRQLPRASRTRA